MADLKLPRDFAEKRMWEYVKDYQNVTHAERDYRAKLPELRREAQRIKDEISNVLISLTALQSLRSYRIDQMRSIVKEHPDLCHFSTMIPRK